jgi:hypothetical protein
MLLGFKRRFAPFVEEGSKTHTIRAKRKIRPKVGEVCHCYVDPRQKSMRLLGRFPCVKVETILIYECGDGRLSVFVGNQELTIDEKNALAWRDGFRGRGPEHAFEEMSEFWLAVHSKAGTLDFEGDLIHWRYTKLLKKAPPRRRRGLDPLAELFPELPSSLRSVRR